jgi:hypothetical protein
MSIKQDYMQLISTPIRWKTMGEYIYGIIDSAAIFVISLDDELNFVVETYYYPSRTIDNNLEGQSLEFVKMVCDESYRLWLREDFITVNGGTIK